MTSLALLVAVGLGGCSTRSELERDFGNSVRHMVRSQQVETAPADTDPVRRGDGERLNGVLEAYRTDVSRPQEDGGQPVVLDFGAAVPR
jgi:hypothetical protein